MFFEEMICSLEFLGIFRIDREVWESESHNGRLYDSLSIRTDGSGHFVTDKGAFSVVRGDLLYIPRAARYRQKTDGETVYAIHLINHRPDDSRSLEVLRLPSADYAETVFREMLDLWKEKKPGYHYQCTALLYSLLARLCREKREESLLQDSSRALISRAVDHIHTHFRAGAVDIASLARLCSVSETYFRRVFRRVYGCTPGDYIRSLRLEYAVQLLDSRLYTVGEISEKAGFSDPKYFSRLFKAVYGVAPSAYGRRSSS